MALLGALALAATQSARAEFGVLLMTTVSDASSTLAVRLYNAGAPSGPGEGPCEKGDPVWLVFDLDGDGIFKKSGGGIGTTPDVTYALTTGTAAAFREAVIDADDYVFYTAVPGPLAGRMSVPATLLPSNLQTGGEGANDANGTVKPAYALLFRGSDFSTGGSFGSHLTVANGKIPQIGNVNLRIGQDVYADSYAFTVGGTVPQPALSDVTATLNAGNLEFAFSFLAASGATYQLYSATNLTPPIQWVPVGDALTGNGAQTQWKVTNGVPPLEQFFRLEAAPAP